MRPWATFPLDSSTLPLCRNNALSTTLLLGKILSRDLDIACVRLRCNSSMRRIACMACAARFRPFTNSHRHRLQPWRRRYSTAACEAAAAATAAGKYSNPTILVRLTHPLNRLQRKEEFSNVFCCQSTKLILSLAGPQRQFPRSADSDWLLGL